jgi:hypothetical protein
MKYCARDVLATHRIFQKVGVFGVRLGCAVLSSVDKVYKLYHQDFVHHNATTVGMLEMSKVGPVRP